MIYNESKFNSEWDTLPLNKLGDFRRGKSKHRPRNDSKLFVGGKYPLIQTGEIKAANLFINSHNATYNDVGLKQSKLWDAGTLCITIAANIAETGILAYPMCFPDSCVGFVADKKMTSELFMHYVFTYIRKSIQNSSLGSIQDNINIDLLTSLDFKIPKKNIQDSIVDLLLTIDSKIETNSSINTELETMAKTIFNYWFVQFDFPNEEGKPYKSNGGEMEYNKVLKREIPNGWKVGSIGDICEVKSGFAFKSDSWLDSGIPVLKIGNIQEDYTISFEGCSHVSEDKVKVAKDYQASPGDIIIAMTGATIGKFGIVPDIDKPVLINQRVGLFKLGDESLQKLPFLINTLKQVHVREMIFFIASGCAQPNISAIEINAIKTVIPPKLFIEKFNQTTKNFFEVIINNHKQTQELITLRDFLLPLLMNGQVNVK
ncbi:MAG: restriction endonuclease subunit S [Ignavibacteriales bacterium]|nr:restriction endonuclease subunit S [Ignavibacteriales bacterium]